MPKSAPPSKLSAVIYVSARQILECADRHFSLSQGQLTDCGEAADEVHIVSQPHTEGKKDRKAVVSQRNGQLEQ